MRLTMDETGRARGKHSAAAAAIRLMRRHSHINWALADQTMVSGVNFLTGILLARFLGLQEFGVFTLAWMAVLFANSFQLAVIISPMMSIGPQQSEADLPAYYGAVLMQQIALAGLSFALLFVGVRMSQVVFPQWQVQHLALPLATAAFAFQAQDFLRRYFFTRTRAAAAFGVDAISYLGQLSLLVWLFQTTGLDTAGALWVIGGTSAAAMIVGIFGMERIAWNVDVLGAVARRHFHFSKWLGVSALMQLGAVNFFVIAAAWVLGASAAGALKAAQNIIGVLHILFQGLENIVPAEASRRLHQKDVRALISYLRRVTWLGATATVLIALVVGVFATFWLRLFYGDDFLAYGNLLRWYALVYVLAFFGTPLRAALRALEYTEPIFWATLGMLLFSLGTAYAITVWWGLTGTMLGILVSFAILQGTLGLALYRAQERYQLVLPD